jgi:hypothetical protein
MSGSLADVLLRIAAAVAPDGGVAVRSTLDSALGEAAPFDAGEILLGDAEGGHRSFPLRGTEGPLVGRDLVDHVLVQGAPFRVDDWRDAEPFPETLGRLRSAGLRSALLLPFHFADAGLLRVTGVLALARSHGWAFVGASLPRLVPLARMAGLALDRALRLSALAERAQALERGFRPGEPAAAAAVPEAHPVDASSERELRGRAEEAETRMREAERVRDEWASRAEALRKRVEEQEAEIQELKSARES